MFRFTIRDVLWLTVVVGLGVGWWLDYQACRRHRTAMNYSVTEANYANMRIRELLRELDSLKNRYAVPPTDEN